MSDDVRFEHIHTLLSRAGLSPAEKARLMGNLYTRLANRKIAEGASGAAGRFAKAAAVYLGVATTLENANESPADLADQR